MPIMFTVEQVREYLLSHGSVYTFRKDKRKNIGKDWMNSGRGKPKICDVDIQFVNEINKPEDLEPYAYNSGFLDVNDWVWTIIILGSDEVKGYLYLVTKL